MSFVLRARKKSATPLPATGLWVVIGLAVVFFLVRYGTELLREHDLREQARTQAALNAVLSDDNARLRSSLLYYRSDHYIEQRAREDLNLRRPDESVLIPVSIAGSSPLTTTTEPEVTLPVPEDVVVAPVVKEDERANWEEWLGLFAAPR